MSKLKYLLFFLIIFLAPTTFADEFNMNSYTSATKGGTKNRYRATEIYNTGASNVYTFGTQYSGRISDIETYFDYPFSANMTYTLTYNMNTDDFRNNFGSSYWWDCDHEMTNTNATVQSVNYISYRKVTFTFTPTEATTCIRVWLRSKNLSSTAITGVSNWRLNNITIYDPEWQNGSSSSSGSQGSSPGSSGTSSTNNNDEIINNATENTHTIVDNQNQNTQDVINNNNTNTEDIINNQDKNNELLDNSISNLTSAIEGCTNLLKNSMFTHNYYNTSGNLVTYGDYFGTELIEINNSNSYYLYNLDKNYRTFVSFFDSNKNYLGRSGSNLISAITLNGNTSWASGSNQWSNTKYIAITHNSSYYLYFLSHTIYLVEGTGKCKNKLDTLNDSINDLGQDIINNQNENSQKELENATCPVGPLLLTFDEWGETKSSYLNFDGSISSSSNWSISPYLIIKPNTTYTIKTTGGNVANYAYYCTYNSSKQKQYCYSFNQGSSASNTLTTNEYAQYVRISLQKSRTFSITGPVCNNWEKESQDKTNEELNDLNNSINNDNVDSGTGTVFFDNFTSEDFGLSQIITIPLNTIQSLTSKTCVPLQVPIPFTNSNVSLPCMTEIYETKFPSIYNLWKIVSFGIISYFIAIDIFHIVKGFKDPESDKVEVLDL